MTIANIGSREVGGFRCVPAGGLHTFRNDSDEPVSLLLLFTPGASREEYFEKAAEYAQRSREELKTSRVGHDRYNAGILDD
ncbi:hypothetical protein ACFYWH_30160 [Streptomyces sp. NPDC003737]|uniref:hypothetical protein n=1 Tax=Streptomyces sp. NPDC003737 TaxID=3364685 RepID=UPI0036B35FAB